MENIEKFGEYEILIYEEQDHEERFTNVDLKNRSNALANGLAGLGVTRGDIVAVILPNGSAVPVSFTGIFKIGAVFLPVIFGLTASEIRYILEDSKAVAIITNEELYPKIQEASKGLETIHHVIVTGRAAVPGTLSFETFLSKNSLDYDMVVMRPDDLAVLMYTSGTTV